MRWAAVACVAVALVLTGRRAADVGSDPRPSPSGLPAEHPATRAGREPTRRGAPAEPVPPPAEPLREVRVSGEDGEVLPYVFLDGAPPTSPPDRWHLPAGWAGCIEASAYDHLNTERCVRPEEPGPFEVRLTRGRPVHLVCVGPGGPEACPAGMLASCVGGDGLNVGSCSTLDSARCTCPAGDAVVVGTGPAPWRSFEAPVVGSEARIEPGSATVRVTGDPSCGHMLVVGAHRAGSPVFGGECGPGGMAWRDLAPGAYALVVDHSDGWTRRHESFRVGAGEEWEVEASGAPGCTMTVDTSTLTGPLHIEVDAPGERAVGRSAATDRLELDAPPGARVRVCGADGGCEVEVECPTTTRVCVTEPGVVCAWTPADMLAGG